jgi:hypothetical protein
MGPRSLVATISGQLHTEVVVEQALELGVPVLPIPYAGGDSSDLLDKHRERIAASFDPGALDQCLGELSKALASHPEMAASAVVDLIRTAKVGRCLVLLPYDEEHNGLYNSSIEPTVARYMIASREARRSTPASPTPYDRRQLSSPISSFSTRTSCSLNKRGTWLRRLHLGDLNCLGADRLFHAFLRK